MAKYSMKPQIRFKGFTDAWEQRKARDLFNSYADKGYPELPVLSATQDAGMVKRDEIGKSVFHDKSNEVGYKRVLPGQFVIHLRSFQGGFAHSNIEGITSPAYTIFGFKPTEKQYDIFWKYIFSSEEFVRRLETVTYGIRDGRSISYDEFLTMGFIVPSYAEQVKIAHGLIITDNLITLHQRKHEKFVNIKKALLEKMFPQGDEKVPRIRFKGFTDAWEQRKLGELCEKFADGDWIEAKDQSSSGIRLIQTGNIGLGEYLDKPNNKKWVSEDTFNSLHCEEVFAGDILISRLPEPAGRACIVPNLGTKMITAVDCTIVRISTKVSKKFLLQHLSSKKYFNEVNTCMAGGTRQRISRSNLANFNVLLPISFEEQESIGCVLCGLDNLITLHQRQVEKLKNIKSALLEKMFV